MSDIYTLYDFIRENDTENRIKEAVVDCIVNNMTKNIAIDILSNDLQMRLYDFIDGSEELNIDGASNVERDFIKTIKEILAEYFCG